MFGFNKYAIYAVIGLAVFAAATGTYFMWKNSIETRALLEFNSKQLEQVVTEQKQFIVTMQNIADEQRKTLSDLNAKNAALSDSLVKIDDYLNSEAARKADRPVSEVLKRTIEDLGR